MLLYGASTQNLRLREDTLDPKPSIVTTYQYPRGRGRALVGGFMLGRGGCDEA